MAQDTWSELAYVTMNIEDVSGNFHMVAMTETIDIDWGDKDVEFIPNVQGGRLAKFSPEGETNVTLEVYPLVAGFAEGSDADVDGVMNFFYQSITPSNGTIDTTSSHDRRKVRLVLRWTTESSVNAEDALDASEENLRLVFADGYVTSVNHEFTDDVLKISMEMKFAPFDRDASSNFKIQSTDGTGTSGTDDLAALSAYTSSNKF